MTDSTGMSCKELVELITEYFEGTLPEEARSRFELHLSFCRSCREYLEQMRLTVKAMGKLTEESIPPAQKLQLLEVFRNWRKS